MLVSPLARLLAAAACLSLPFCAANAQRIQYSSEHRDAEHVVPQTVSGGSAKLRSALSSGRTALSLASADFDQDGTPDLITGYNTAAGGALLLQRGNPHAHAPAEAEWATLATGQMVPPYAEKAEAIQLPVRPDLLHAADLSGLGHPGLVVAAKGDNTLYVLDGLGNGSFAAPRAVSLAGGVRSLSTWKSPEGELLLVAGVCGNGFCGLQVLDREGETKSLARTPSAPVEIEQGRVNGGSTPDLAVIAGGSVLVVDGSSLLTKSPVIEQLPATNAVAVAPGYFVTDRRGYPQIAVLGADATVHVYARAGLDTSLPSAAAQHAPGHHALPVTPDAGARVKLNGLDWADVETVLNVGPGGTGVKMMRAHLLVGGNDDLAVLTGGQYITVAHRVSTKDGQSVTTPVVTLDTTSQDVVAALPARVAADPRQSVLLLGKGAHPLTVSSPSTYHTYTVNTTSDTNDTLTTAGRCTTGIPCSLRDAVNLTNMDLTTNESNGKLDVVLVPAGTYNLTTNNPTPGTTTAVTPDVYGSYNTHLELDGPISLQGSSASNTIIDGQYLDQILAINAAAYTASNINDYNPTIFDVFVSNITLRNAYNRNTPTSSACAQNYCNTSGGAISWAAAGTTGANLVLNSVTVSGSTGSTSYGGGGIDAFLNSNYGNTLSGPLEIDNSTLSNNTDRVGFGGGFEADQYIPFVLSGTTLSGNVTSGTGAGLYANSPQASPSPTYSISGSTISSNTSQGYGGGLWTGAGLLTMSTTSVTGNSAHAYGGGGFMYNANINTSNFTGNTVKGTSGAANVPYQQDGAAFCGGADGTAGDFKITLNYSRIFNNTGDYTGSPAAKSIGGGCSLSTTNGNGGSVSNYDILSLANNWWGCQAGPNGGTGCSTAGIDDANAGTITLTPYTILTLSTNTPIVGGQTITATGGLFSNNSGTAYSAPTQTVAYSGLPASISITQYASSTSTTSGTLASTGKISASATATSPGNGTASITVDNATVSANFTVTAPDLVVTSSHSGNFKAGDSADNYTLNVSNIGTSPTTSTVTLTDTLPTGFTATNYSGTGWTCNISSSPVSCTNNAAVAASVSYPPLMLTVSIAPTDAGTYTNQVSVSGGGETNTGNNTGSDPTVVVGPPTIAVGFNPATVAPYASSTLTFTLGNPSANSVSLTGAAFTGTIPSGLQILSVGSVSSSCGSPQYTATSYSVTGATVASGSTCSYTLVVSSSAIGSYTVPTNAPTATNSNAGTSSSGTLTVSVTPTRLVYTNAPDSPITAGGNSGPIQVALEDAAGNIATNNSSAVVSLTVTASGYATTTYTAVASAGVASFSAVTLTTAGTYTYTATTNGLTSAVFNETVNPGAFTSLVGAGPTSFSAPGQPGSITIRAVDSYGNTVIGFTGTVTFTSSDPLATLPAAYTYAASDAGSHTFSYSFGTAKTATTLSAATSGYTLTQSGIVVNDCILFINSNGTLSRLTDAGIATSPSAGYTGGGAPTIGIALDSTGDIWSVNPATSILSEFSKAGVALSGSGFTGGGLGAPNAVAVDGLGFVWVVNGTLTNGVNTLSVFTNAGVPVSGTPLPLTGTGANSLAIDLSGNLWITNSLSNTLTEIVGGAAPAPPLATGVVNVTTGTRP